MFKKIILCLTFVLFSYSLSGSVLAGGYSGGGGVTIVCQEGDRRTVRLLDLWEYENGLRRGQLVSMPQQTLRESLAWVAERIANLVFYYHPDFMPELLGPRRLHQANKDNLNQQILGELQDIHARMAQVEVGIVPISDFQMRVTLPNGCQVVQAAVYDDRLNTWAVNSQLFQAMTPIDQLGLVMHEWAYRRVRSYYAASPSLELVERVTVGEETRDVVRAREVTSDSSRDFVALVLSNNIWTPEVSQRIRSFIGTYAMPDLVLSVGPRVTVSSLIAQLQRQDRHRFAGSRTILNIGLDTETLFNEGRLLDELWPRFVHCGLRNFDSCRDTIGARWTRLGGVDGQRFEIVSLDPWEDFEYHRSGGEHDYPFIEKPNRTGFSRVTLRDHQTGVMWTYGITAVELLDEGDGESSFNGRFRVLYGCGQVGPGQANNRYRFATANEIREFRGAIQDIPRLNTIRGGIIDTPISQFIRDALAPSRGVSAVRQDHANEVWGNGLFSFSRNETYLSARPHVISLFPHRLYVPAYCRSM